MSTFRILLIFLLPATVTFGQSFEELGPAPAAPSPKFGIAQTVASAPYASWFDTSNRAPVQNLYLNLFQGFQNVAYGWTGNVSTCVPGTLSLDYVDGAALRFNFVRGLAGVPAGITFDTVVNGPKQQQAALIMSANQQLSHSPPTSWTCYSAAGAAAAGQSNLCLNLNSPNDPGCIAQYMNDSGANNTAVGHRRWILYPQTQISATGDIPQNGSFYRANALLAFDSNFGLSRPATRDNFVAWPSKGYFPYQLVPSSQRWSFSFPGADFSAASVTMTANGAPVAVTLLPVQAGAGENTVVWTAGGLTLPPVTDITVAIQVSNVLISGSPQSFSYSVILFDPSTPSLTITPTGVFRSASGAIWLTKQSSPALFSAGGAFASDPAAAQNSSSDTFVAARDASNAIWLNVFTAASQTWGGWIAAGAVAQGTPAISVSTNGSGYVAMRDSFNSYWLRSYTIGSGLGAWTPLGGVFTTDPVMAAGYDGSIYIIGKDGGNSIWSGRYTSGGGFQGWQSGGGSIKGKPSVAAGVDGAAYVAGRDFSNGTWMGRVQGNTWTGWWFGGGISNTDPVNGRVGNRNYTVFLDGSGAVWYRPFLEGFGNGWESSWASSGGVLQTVAPAGSGPDLYLVGQDTLNAVWWNKALASQWTRVGGAAAGSLAAGPR